MQIRVLNTDDMGITLDLFCKCFVNDHYYKNLFPDCADISERMRVEFRDGIYYCLETGLSIGIFNSENRLIGFTLLFDYNLTFQNRKDAFYKIFGVDESGNLQYYNDIHAKIKELKGNVMYLLDIAVSEEYQRQGLASQMVDFMLTNYSNYNIVSDVSNTSSLGMYSKRGFEITKIEEDYYFVEHRL
jgi:ribosomal protein S18 acetylase RimI-like enzyme